MYKCFKTETDVAQNLIDDFFLIWLSENISIGRILSKIKYGVTGLLSEKTGALYAEFNEIAEAAIISYYPTGDFLICIILFLWPRIIRRSYQGVQFINFQSQVFLNDINHGCRAAIMKKNYLWLRPFYMSVASYCYYEKVRRTMCTVTVSYLLKLKFGT